MTQPRHIVSDARTGRTLALSGLLVVQVAAGAFFTLDVFADATGFYGLTQGNTHLAMELIAAVALIVGVALTAHRIRRISRRQRHMEAQLRVASGAFADLLEEHFEGWRLTPSERDVALLAIKGLSIAEMSSVRQTKEGTIKAQCNAIYSKANVSGRAQLLSLFIEELLTVRLVPLPRGQ